MKKIFIATPCFDGKVHIQYALSLANTYKILEGTDIEIFSQICCAGSLLVAERNNLIQLFLKTDCTHLLFIDSDLGWSPISVKNMIEYEKDFIVGIYPMKSDGKFILRPSLNNDESLVKEGELILLEYAPSGFMLIKRETIEHMIRAYPEYNYDSKDPSFPKGVALFNTEVRDGMFWGEDYTFCKRARDVGIKIYCDPTVWFDHAGKVGRLIDIITDQPPECKSDLH